MTSKGKQQQRSGQAAYAESVVPVAEEGLGAVAGALAGALAGVLCPQGITIFRHSSSASGMHVKVICWLTGKPTRRSSCMVMQTWHAHL